MKHTNNMNTVLKNDEKSYVLILVYKSSITKEQVVESLNNVIVPIIKKLNFNIIKVSYCDNKTFAYPINKHKNGHYSCIGFNSTINNKNNVNAILASLVDMDVLLRKVIRSTNNVEKTIEEIINFDTYTEEKISELS